MWLYSIDVWQIQPFLSSAHMDTKHLLLKISDRLCQYQQLLCTAESCTGGLIASQCTEISGSSQWFERGFVTYSNEAKHDSIGVPQNLIEQFGAVSPEVAKAMAQGALIHSQAHWSIAVTGIAGPTGGTVTKPVGLVYFGFAWRTSLNQTDLQTLNTHIDSQIFSGDRSAIRTSAVKHAFQVLTRLLYK